MIAVTRHPAQPVPNMPQASAFEVARHLLAAIIEAQTNGIPAPPEFYDDERDRRRQVIIARMRDQGATDEQIELLEDTIAAAAVVDGPVIEHPPRTVDVPIPFALDELSHVAISPVLDLAYDHGCVHPMFVQFICRDGRLFDLDLTASTTSYATHPEFTVKPTPAVPAFDPGNFWHRALGPSKRTYSLCRLILGATPAIVAAEVGQAAFAIEKLATEIAHLTDPAAAMPDYWPADFHPNLVEPDNRHLLADRFGVPIPMPPEDLR